MAMAINDLAGSYFYFEDLRHISQSHRTDVHFPTVTMQHILAEVIHTDWMLVKLLASNGKGDIYNLPKETTYKLQAWFVAHLKDPYPSYGERQDLMRRTGLQMNDCFSSQ